MPGADDKRSGRDKRPETTGRPAAQRKKRVLFIVLSLTVLSVAALCGHGVPCAFRMITGWQCPGCGITTLFLSLLHGDVRAAFLANPFLFCTLPLLVIYVICFFCLPRRGSISFWLEKALPAAYLVCLIVFGILRNMNL